MATEAYQKEQLKTNSKKVEEKENIEYGLDSDNKAGSDDGVSAKRKPHTPPKLVKDESSPEFISLLNDSTNQRRPLSSRRNRFKPGK